MISAGGLDTSGGYFRFSIKPISGNSGPLGYFLRYNDYRLTVLDAILARLVDDSPEISEALRVVERAGGLLREGAEAIAAPVTAILEKLSEQQHNLPQVVRAILGLIAWAQAPLIFHYLYWHPQIREQLADELRAAFGLRWPVTGVGFLPNERVNHPGAGASTARAPPRVQQDPPRGGELRITSPPARSVVRGRILRPSLTL